MATIQFQDIPGNTGRYRNVPAITGYYHYVPLIADSEVIARSIPI